MELITNNTVAELKVVYHPQQMINEKALITCAQDAVSILLEGYNRHTMALQEQFVILYLNRANQVLGVYKASVGGITGTVADPRLILGVALRICAVALILSHNHPSGSLTPSQADKDLTRKITEGAKLFDMKVLDHLIMNHEGKFYSFAEEGTLTY